MNVAINLHFYIPTTISPLPRNKNNKHTHKHTYHLHLI